MMTSQKYSLGIQSASYIIYKDKSTIKAVNGTTGVVDYSGTDAATVIQNAINSFDDSSDGAGVIFIKRGTYTISTQIDINYDRISIRGEGPQSTTLKLANNVNNGKHVINIPIGTSATVYTNISDLRIDGNKANNASAGSGIYLGGSHRGIIQNVHVYYCRQHGIMLEGSTDIGSLENSFINCVTPYNDGDGIRLGTHSGDGHYYNIFSYGNTGYGFNIESSGSSANVIVHVHVYNNTLSGIRITSKHNVLYNCMGDTNKQHGIIVAADHNSLIGCYCFNSSQELADTYSGIYISNAKENIITGCLSYDWQGTKTQKCGIEEAGTSNLNNIINNMVKDNSVANIVTVGGSTKVKNNIGYATEDTMLSNTFAIDSTGIKTVTMTHGLDITPTKSSCSINVNKVTNVTDWAYNLLIIDSIDATNVTVKIKISQASATAGATAKLGLRVGNS